MNQIMAVVAIVSFGAMAGLSTYAIVDAIAPQWRRIWQLACGHVEKSLAPIMPLSSDEVPQLCSADDPAKLDLGVSA